MLNAAIRDCPVFGGKVKSVDDKAALASARREEGRARRRLGGRGRRRHLVAREDGARRAADRVGLRPQRDGVERGVRRRAEGGPRREGRGGRQRERRRARGDRGRAEADRGRVLVPAPEPRDDGADERDGALDAGALRGLDADAERRGRARRGRRSVGPAGRAVRCLQDAPGRRLRPARRGAGLGAPGGADREGDARHAGQADLVARGGHDRTAATTR